MFICKVLIAPYGRNGNCPVALHTYGQVCSNGSKGLPLDLSSRPLVYQLAIAQCCGLFDNEIDASESAWHGMRVAASGASPSKRSGMNLYPKMEMQWGLIKSNQYAVINSALIVY